MFNYLYCYSFIIPPLVLWPCCIYKLVEVFIIEPPCAIVFHIDN